MRVARVVVAESPRACAATGPVIETAGPPIDEAWLTGRPRIALSRDGALYDVEGLDRAFDEPSPDIADPSDFHTRVATLRSAGLLELDARLLRGERPSSTRIPNECAMLLAPCDTDRAALVVVDVRDVVRGGAPIARLGQARSLLGDGALVGMPGSAETLHVEASLGVLVGDDLRSVGPREAASAIQGYALFVDWFDATGDRAAVAGASGALGPHLVSRYVLPKLADARVSMRVGSRTFEGGKVSELGISIADAIAFASRELDVRSGDVVVVGPLPGGSTRALGSEARHHEPVDVTLDAVGTLRTSAVPRR